MNESKSMNEFVQFESINATPRNLLLPPTRATRHSLVVVADIVDVGAFVVAGDDAYHVVAVDAVDDAVVVAATADVVTVADDDAFVVVDVHVIARVPIGSRL